MRVLSFVLGSLVLLAGCIGDEPVESGEIETANAQAEAQSSSTTTTTTNATVETPKVPRAFTIAIQGKTGTWACAPDGPSSCMGLPVGTPSENTFVIPEYEGDPQSLELALSWSAQTPATQEMYVFVGALTSCGDGCFEFQDGAFSASASGNSPVTLSAPDVVVRPGEVLFVHAGTISPTPPLPVPFFYSIDQAFAIDGTLNALVNATA